MALQTELAHEDLLIVDLTDVYEIDTSGLQLLLALKREQSVTLINHSDAITQFAARLQLHEAIGLEARP